MTITAAKIAIPAEVQKFQESYAAFQKYQAALKETPGLLGFYGGRLHAVSQAAGSVNKAIDKYSNAVPLTQRAQEKLAAVAQAAGSSFKSLGDNVKRTVENLARTALNPLSILFPGGWSAAAIGLATGSLAGIFGVHELAQGAATISARRRSALGLGVSYGQLTATDVILGNRLGIGEGNLSAASTGLYDFTSPQYQALRASGTAGQADAAKAVLGVIDQIPSMFAGVPESGIGAQARATHLTDIMDLEQIIRILKSTPEERSSIRKQYEDASKAFDIPPELQKKWADFDTQLERARVKIETVLMDKLAPLAQPLTKLSDDAVNLISAFAKSDVVSTAANGAAGGLGWLAGELSSDEFKNSIKKFEGGLEALGPYLRSFGHVMKVLAGFGINVARLIADPNYNPSSIWDLLGGQEQKEVPKSSINYSDNPTGRAPSIRYHTWRGPGTLNPEYRGGTVDSKTGKITFPRTLKDLHQPGSTDIVGGISASSVKPQAGETPEQLAIRVGQLYPQLTTGQCVELAFKASGFTGTTRDIHRGPSAWLNQVPTGTPIATFMDRQGRPSLFYDGGVGVGAPGNGTTHMGIVAGYGKDPATGKDGILIIEQYVDSQGKHVPPHARWLDAGDPRGGEWDANNYYIPLDKNNLPIGPNDPYRKAVIATIKAVQLEKAGKAAAAKLGVDDPSHGVGYGTSDPINPSFYPNWDWTKRHELYGGNGPFAPDPKGSPPAKRMPSRPVSHSMTTGSPHNSIVVDDQTGGQAKVTSSYMYGLQ
jgi:hypothetical protein